MVCMDRLKFGILPELICNIVFVANKEMGELCFWVGIKYDALLEPFSVSEVVKLKKQAYTLFLDEHLSRWLSSLLLFR